MKALLKIKWELVVTILMAICTLISWSIFQNDLNDWRMLVLTFIPTIMLCTMIASYTSIKDFRHEVINLWK